MNPNTKLPSYYRGQVGQNEQTQEGRLDIRPWDDMQANDWQCLTQRLSLTLKKKKHLICQFDLRFKKKNSSYVHGDEHSLKQVNPTISK